VGGVAAGLAVAAVVQHQHAVVLGTGGRVGHQQLDPASVHLLGVPARLREKPLQPLHGAVLGTDDRLGAGQRGERLVAVSWQQQACR
jgi:hypothetical protein